MSKHAAALPESKKRCVRNGIARLLIERDPPRARSISQLAIFPGGGVPFAASVLLFAAGSDRRGWGPSSSGTENPVRGGLPGCLIPSQRERGTLPAVAATEGSRRMFQDQDGGAGLPYGDGGAKRGVAATPPTADCD